MNDRELRAEIVQSGTWLYADEVPTDVWIVKQNFEYHREEDYDDGPEELNSDREAFQVVMARGRQMISLGPAALSLSEAISAAEAAIPTKINWTNHIQQKLFGGRWYSLDSGRRTLYAEGTPKTAYFRMGHYPGATGLLC